LILQGWLKETIPVKKEMDPEAKTQPAFMGAGGRLNRPAPDNPFPE
jgi:hypothetical protein